MPYPRYLNALWLIVALCCQSGCLSPSMLNVVISDKHYRVTPDQFYGTHVRQRLDVYEPTLASTIPAKVVVFFYGNQWQIGSKTDYQFVAEALTAQGFVVVIPDYRAYPFARFPAFVEDAAAALRWVHQNIQDHNGDPDLIYLLGHSAGAHIAALLTLDKRYAVAPMVRGMIGLAGLYDFLPLNSLDLQATFEPAARLEETQPIYFVDGSNPPMLLLSGDNDKTVNPGNSLRLAARIREKGGSVQLILYPGVGHLLILTALAPPLQTWAPTLFDITQFIKRY